VDLANYAGNRYYPIHDQQTVTRLSRRIAAIPSNQEIAFRNPLPVRCTAGSAGGSPEPALNNR